ncbi:Adenylate kinase [Dethiosulfatibacter aminovorans DSM 17477]|uniref:Adenylate kinase n=1 Tax=Dethiosulfatibacter aminovorans DSM 17477 TaxID=1121476 RepID=A0A1M6DNP0_9FIRM|nr:hypothetical protein [Dethiosulfatibacter aminovorans]SHI74877.1 Adenylate kinase [Dethiosulfatibacter aminovorans DSM 17477]
MDRILVLGPCGAGKSHLGDKLGRKLKLPVYHLDSIFWNPGWVESDGDEFLKAINEIVARGKWIIDGNYTNYWGNRLDRCDAIILLDYSRRVCFYRTVMRILRGYNKVRSDMAEGCPERFDWEFLKYSWNFRKDKMYNLYEVLEKYKGEKKIYVFRKPSDLEVFIRTKSGK